MTGLRIGRWLSNLRALEHFLTENDRWPVRKRDGHSRPDAQETQLADWLREQRRYQDRLRSWQIEMLESLPGFDWRPRDDVWDRHFAAYVQFVGVEGRIPRAGSSNEAERRLVIWATRQRYLHRRGLLAKHRADELAALAFWTWGKGQARRQDTPSPMVKPGTDR